MRGQGYDGASNVSSDAVGVQTQIKRETPLAIQVYPLQWSLPQSSHQEKL